MGANCCVAAKKPQPCVAVAEVSAYRNIRYSPSWSFRWDNRTHIEDIMDNATMFSNHGSGNIQPEIKSGSIAPAEGISNVGHPSDMFRSVEWYKSDKMMEKSKIAKADTAENQSITSNSSLKAKDPGKSTNEATVSSDINKPNFVPSTPLPVPRADPSASRSFSLSIEADLMRKACQSPGYQLCRQVSDSKAASLKSLNESSSPGGRPSSSMPSVCSNYLTAGRSHGGSSDGWSVRTFSELVAKSSQKESWSMDCELLGSITSKGTRSNASHHAAASPEQQMCKLCLKLLKERSSWNAQELVVVAVLFCGHAYHADCLDGLTAEVDKYEPLCPVCTYGEKCSAKLFGKLESKVKNKMSKSAITDIDLDGGSKHQKKSGKVPRLGTSSRMKGSFSRPFLRRHFSIGSRPSRSVSESESMRKKGFWVRQWRE